MVSDNWMVDFFRPYITSNTCQYSILKKIIRIIIRPVQDTFKKYLDTDTCPKKYLDTDTFKILLGKIST